MKGENLVYWWSFKSFKIPPSKFCAINYVLCNKLNPMIKICMADHIKYQWFKQHIISFMYQLAMWMVMKDFPNIYAKICLVFGHTYISGKSWVYMLQLSCNTFTDIAATPVHRLNAANNCHTYMVSRFDRMCIICLQTISLFFFHHYLMVTVID